MIASAREIEEVVTGKADPKDNVLKNAPHTAAAVTTSEWTHPYTREQAAFPLPWVRERKFWPSVGRIDNPYGDRNLFCTCPPMEAVCVAATRAQRWAKRTCGGDRMRILNAAQMRDADRQTIEEIGIPSLVLMENAGRQVVAAIESLYEISPMAASRVCGSGNNGGDGFVVARTLLQRGIDRRSS